MGAKSLMSDRRLTLLFWFVVTPNAFIIFVWGQLRELGLWFDLAWAASFACVSIMMNLPFWRDRLNDISRGDK